MTMVRHPRKLVTGSVMRRPFPAWPETRYFVLECGHEVHQGGDSYWPKRCACAACGQNLSDDYDDSEAAQIAVEKARYGATET
jgi:hypothetical protein